MEYCYHEICWSIPHLTCTQIEMLQVNNKYTCISGLAHLVVGIILHTVAILHNVPIPSSPNVLYIKSGMTISENYKA